MEQEEYREMFREIDRKYEEERKNMPEVVAFRHSFSDYNENRSIQDIERALSKGIDVNVQDASGDTPLHWAAYTKWLEGVSYLLDQGAKRFVLNAKGERPVDQSWYWDEHSEMNDLLGKHEIDCLVEASKKGDLGTVRYFLEKDHSPDTLDFFGYSILSHACRDDHRELVMYLLEQGANVNLKNQDGATPLIEAVNWHYDLAIVKALLDRGADINAVMDSGTSALHLAACKDEDITRYLVERGANIHHVCKQYEMSTLTCAAKEGNVSGILYLLSLGMDVNHVDSFGKTPLMWAAEQKIGAVRALLRHGADASMKDKDGWDALRYADYRGHDQIEHVLKKAMGQ